MFPDRYIIKPNLIKSRVFKSAKNTNCQTEASMNEGDYYDEFNINDAIEGKNTKRKSKAKSRENTTFDNVTFNPFGPKSQRKKIKGQLEDKRSSNLGKSSLMINNENENENDNDMEIYNDYDMENPENCEEDLDEEEYKRKMEFYKKMLKNDNDNETYNRNNTENGNVNSNVENLNECNNNCNKENTSLNESRRLKKKENPCLVDSQID